MIGVSAKPSEWMRFSFFPCAHWGTYESSLMRKLFTCYREQLPVYWRVFGLWGRRFVGQLKLGPTTVREDVKKGGECLFVCEVEAEVIICLRPGSLRTVELGLMGWFLLGVLTCFQTLIDWAIMLRYSFEFNISSIKMNLAYWVC